MDIDLSIARLFKLIGVEVNAFDPKLAPVVGIKKMKRSEQGIYGSPYYANDAMGTEYYLPVTIRYRGDDGRMVYLRLPYPVISVKSRKTIIETPLTERRGTVKEVVNIRDYEIRIRGFSVNQRANELLEEDIIALRNLYEQNVPLSIDCPLTDIFLLRPDRSGSDKVVITDFDLPEMVGVKHVRHYVLEMVSDEPFDLTSIV